MSWLRRKNKDPRSFLEICPEGLYDIHAHILPGVDDGPVSWDDSLKILKGMAEIGYIRVTATPHFDSRTFTPDPAMLSALNKELLVEWGEKSPKVSIGAEILFDDFFFQEEHKQSFPTIGNERTYLVELGFGPGSVPSGVEDVFFKFQIKGPHLVLAHPERIPDLQMDPLRIDRICRTGTYLQLDLMSIVGRYGKEAEKVASMLLEKGLCDFASSDLHSPKDLGTLKKSLRKLADQSEDEFVRLVCKNPKNLMEGRMEEVERNA